MADLGTNGPLIASLLQAQRQDENPFQAQRNYGRKLIVQGSSPAPLQSGSWLEGLARALQAGVGGYFAGQATRDENAQTESNIGVYSAAYKKALGDPQNNISPDPQGAIETLKGLKGGGAQQEALIGQLLQSGINTAVTNQQATGALNRRYPGTPGGGLTIDVTKPNTSTAPGSQTPDAAIAGIETGGNNDYRAIGPVSLVNGRPSRPYGKYQVMDFNIGPWTKEVTGQEMTPEQFVKDPQAQEAVFKTKFGQYTQQYGPNGAARAWFAGPGGMNNPNAADVNGTTVAQYGNRFNQATGGQPPSPQGPQMAQAAPTAPAPAMAPVPQIQPSPEAARTRAEAQSLRQSDPVKALQLYERADQEEAKWITDRAAKASDISMQGTEHDRQQASATPSNEMSLSAGFADRMANSERMIRQFSPALTSGAAKAKDMIPFGIGNFAQSPEYQQAKQARDDFINAQLRRESGAAIAPTEYTNADRQYFPQPGDGPDVIAQKERNRQLAIEGMVRNAGPTYQASPTVRAPAAKGGSNELLDQAREAIKAGKDRAKVIEVLKANGGDPSQL